MINELTESGLARTHHKLYLFFTLMAIALLLLFISMGQFFGDMQIVNEPLHSTFESLGGIAAIFMAVLLFQKSDESNSGRYFMLAVGFLGVGLLDVFHAIVLPGQGFVFLRSIATLIGGVWFVLALPASSVFRKNAFIKKRILWFALAVDIFFISWVLFAEQSLPVMLQNGEFTGIARAINLSGGMLFILAAVFLLYDFHRFSDIEIYSLASISMLFGVAGLFFADSSIWTSTWWWWHLLRLGGYFIVLASIYKNYLLALTEQKRSRQELQKAYEELEVRVEDRTAELKESEGKIRKEKEFTENLLTRLSEGIAVVNDDKKMIFVNEALCKMTGFERDELINERMPFKYWAEENIERIKDTHIETMQDVEAEYEFIFKRKNSERFIALVSPRKTVDSEGNTIFFMTVRDITKRKKAKELSDALNDINTTINSTLDFDRIMKSVIAEAREAIATESTAILLREEGEWIVRYLNGLPQDHLGARFSGLTGADMAVSTGKPLVSDDAYNDARLNREIVEKYQIRSMMIAALKIKDEVVGALYFMNHSAPIPFTGVQVDFIEKLAACVSLSIENSRLYEAERNIADILQRSLLTVPEKIQGIEFDHLYQSAKEKQGYVGGDFYDIFELDGNKVGVIIGDISGKGLEAAKLTAIVRDAIESFVLFDSSPASVISKTNKVVSAKFSKSTFVTIFFGVLDKETGILTYCCAGHPPAIIKRKKLGIDILTTKSPAVLSMCDMKYTEDQVKLEKEDILVLYTDGVTEARFKGELFGEERLIEFILEASELGVTGLPQKIFDEINKFTAGKLLDDVAIICVSRE